MNPIAITGLMWVLTTGAAGGQTVYKCPSPTPGAPPVIQQMPCPHTGGGEQIKITPPNPGRDESAEATARMKAYSESLNNPWKTQEEDKKRTRELRPDSSNDHIQRIKGEELAKDCYALEKKNSLD